MGWLCSQKVRMRKFMAHRVWSESVRLFQGIQQNSKGSKSWSAYDTSNIRVIHSECLPKLGW